MKALLSHFNADTVELTPIWNRHCLIVKRNNRIIKKVGPAEFHKLPVPFNQLEKLERSVFYAVYTNYRGKEIQSEGRPLYKTIYRLEFIDKKNPCYSDSLDYSVVRHLQSLKPVNADLFKFINYEDVTKDPFWIYRYKWQPFTKEFVLQETR